MTDNKLKRLADQTIASWNVDGLSYRISGKFAFVQFLGQEHKCMKFNLLQLLNHIAVESL